MSAISHEEFTMPINAKCRHVLVKFQMSIYNIKPDMTWGKLFRNDSPCAEEILKSEEQNKCVVYG
jgi:hypothetical protein